MDCEDRVTAWLQDYYLGLTQKSDLMGRQAVEKAIESLHERKSDSFELCQ